MTTEDKVEPTKELAAAIKVLQLSGYYTINFDRVIDAVEYFEQFNPAKKDYTISLYIKFDKTFDKHAEKSVVWYINKT